MTDNTAITIPFAGARPAQAFAALPAESLAEGIGSSYGIIGYKGKVWSLRYRGEKHTFVRADDGSPMSYIDVIILRSPSVKSKSYYPREEGYDPNSSDGKRPTCSAIDGVTPDADIVNPQAKACAMCPRNEWKSDANGRKSRDCSDAKRLAVLLMPTQTKALLGSPLLEPVFLRVPPASLNDLGVMGETMEKQGWHYSSFVTRVSFDPDQPHPKMVFRPIQQLTDAEAPVVLPMREDPMALRITGEDVMNSGGQRPLAVTRAPAIVQPPAPAAAPAVQPSPAIGLATPSPSPAPSVAPVETGLTGAPVVAVAPAVAPPAVVSPSKPAVQVQQPAPVVDTGFGMVAGPMTSGLLGGGPVTAAVTAQAGPTLDLTANPPAGAALQTADDVGAPSESDLDLDARVAKLLEVA